METARYTYDEIADTIFRPIYPRIAEDILSATGVTGGRMVDVGCGGGHLGLALMERAPFTGTFLDVREEALALARRRAEERGLLPRSSFLAGDVHQIALPDGCADLDAQGVERWLAQRAASLDASAGLQTFTVSLTGPARFNADYFALLQDLLTKPRFEEQEVRREVSDMLSDLRQRADRPTGLLFSRLNPFLYPNGQPYGLDPLGTPESLARFTPKDVRSFWEQQLRQPWVLAVAGDFDREAVLTFARSLPVPQGKALSVSLPVWGTDKKLDLHLPGRNQAHVLEVFRAVPPDHPDAPALLLLQAVLSGQSGLLFSQMRDVEGLGYTVTAFYRAMPLAGMMAFYIGTTPDKVEQARQGFARIIAQVQAKALPEELLRAAVNRLRGEYYRDRQSLGARAGESATDAVLGRPQGFDLTLIDKAAKLSPEQVQTAARIYLTPPNRYDLLLQP